jgi:secondary thiamine-phosphate synthase enzyme
MELVDITSLIAEAMNEHHIINGICFLFNPHTTAALTINEGADPDVQKDIIDGFTQMVPMDLPFKHREGNSPAHIMASLMGASEIIVIRNGHLELGTWQKIFFCEFDGPRTRSLTCNFLESN